MLGWPGYRTITIALVAGLLPFVNAAPAAAQTTSLADALAHAYITNPQLRLQQATVRSADEDVIIARGDLLPNLSQSSSISKNYDLGNTIETFSGSTALNEQLFISVETTLSQQLWDGGADKLEVESARMSLLAARQALKDVEQSILLRTVEAFMNVRRDQDFVRLARNNVRVLREQVRAAKDRFEVGEVTRTDVSQAEARLAAALSGLEANKGALKRAVDSYVAVVGIAPINLRTPPPAPKIPATVEKAEAVAIRSHPRVVEAQFSAKAAEHTLQATNRNRALNITGSVAHSVSRRPQRDGLSTNQIKAAISGQLNIYSGGQLDAARRKALAGLEQALANVQLQGYLTRQSIREAYTARQVARASIISGREQVRAAQVAFEGVKEEAKLGARTTLDALDAEQEVLVARSNLVSAIRDEYVAVYRVLSEMGLLTAQHLNLGVPIYNPDINYSKALTLQRNPLGIKRLKLFEKIKKRKGE